MRKVILTLAGALCLGTATVKAEKISRTEARELASMAVEIDDTASDDVDWSPYYVFSRGAGQGFVIVSGDDQTAPIIGIIDQGDFVLSEMPVQLQQMLGAWSERIIKLQGDSSRKQVKRRSAQRIREAVTGVDKYKANWTSVAPLCQTHWHQSPPYNDMAPCRTDNGARAMTGCVATAGAQVLYYFRKDLPDTLLYNTPTYTYGNAPVTVSLPKGTPIEYDLMKLSGSGTAKQNKAVATLMYAVGTSSWLTYADGDGTATSGQLYKLGNAMSDQFKLKTSSVSKWSYTQQNWEQLAYANLSEGRPMVYAGANDDGGHAVVLDGYQANTGLYHFNFGWGGTGDGYYTIDDETGMNGYKSYQEMLSGAAPAKQNLSGTIKATELYQKCNNKIECVVRNNGTLPYSGFKLWASTTGKRSSSAADTETATVIESGDSATISFTYKPILGKTYYLFLSDANNNVLDTVEILPTATKADLILTDFDVAAGQTTDTYNGLTYKRVNNTTAIVNGIFKNSEAGTYCEPQVKCVLQKLNTETGEWEASKTKTITIEEMESGETQEIEFMFVSLSPGTRYKAYMDRTVKAGENSELTITAADTATYFTVTEPTLTIAAEGRKATVTGDWDSYYFTKLATDTTVTAYDMTAVNELNAQPVADNPNALFYANANNFDGTNVVVGNVCKALVIHTGYNFRPNTAFTATTARLVLTDIKAGHWVDAIVPFAAPLPQGMVAKRVSEVKSASMQLENLTSVPAMTPLLLLTDYDKRNVITAENVTIGLDTTGYHLDGLLSGQTTDSKLTASASLLGYNENDYPYYYVADSGTTVKPFATVLNKTYKNGYRAMGSVGIDRAYILLADTLNKALTIYEEYQGTANQTALQIFADSIINAEKYFEVQDAESSSDISKQTRWLSEAIEAFLKAIQGEATAIESVTLQMTRPADDTLYDLSGRKVARPAKAGIYISNGKKRIMR